MTLREELLSQRLQFIYFPMLYRKQNSIEFHKNKIREEHFFEKKNQTEQNSESCSST
jgi:hypothetical protein